MKDKQRKNGSASASRFSGRLKKSKPRSETAGNARAVSTVSPHSQLRQKNSSSGNTDEIAAESADAVDETEDYAGLEDVEPEFSQQDAPVQRDGADDDGEYPGIRF